MPRVIFRHTTSTPAEPAASTWGPAVAEGVASSVAVAATAAWRGQVEGHNAWRPLNAISHILWGAKAADQERATIRYTASGLVINLAACLFWAWIYEGRSRRTRRAPSLMKWLGRGAVVTVIAYVTDYHVVPRRFTPGFELSLSRRSLPWLYGALAAGLCFPRLLESSGAMRRNSS